MDSFMCIGYSVARLCAIVMTIGLSACSLSGCSAMDEANRRAAADQANALVTLTPPTPYDPAEHAAAMEQGTSGIDGVAFAYWKKNPIHLRAFQEKIFAANQRVVLLPATKYVRDWYDLRKKRENSRTKVELDPAAVNAALVAQADAYGRFGFRGLKPGTYYLASSVSWNESGSRNVATGWVEGSDGSSATMYEKQGYVTSHGKVMEKFVTIKADGEIVEVELSN